VGPLFAWRRTSAESLKRNFFWPAVASLALGLVLLIVAVRDVYPLMTFVFSAFVAITIGMEFYRGARVIQTKQGRSLVPAMVELTHRNTRRYGGYLVHMGIVIMFVGFAGSAFNEFGQQEMQEGDTLEVGRYGFHLRELSQSDSPLYFSRKAEIDVLKNGEKLETLEPEQRFYHASQQTNSLVAIRPRLSEDVYLVYAGMSNDGSKPVIQAYINPLVNFVWLGGFVLVLGTLVALVPSKVKRIYPRTRVVGAVRKEREVVAHR